MAGRQHRGQLSRAQQRGEQVLVGIVRPQRAQQAGAVRHDKAAQQRAQRGQLWARQVGETLGGEEDEQAWAAWRLDQAALTGAARWGGRRGRRLLASRRAASPADGLAACRWHPLERACLAGQVAAAVGDEAPRLAAVLGRRASLVRATLTQRHARSGSTSEHAAHCSAAAKPAHRASSHLLSVREGREGERTMCVGLRTHLAGAWEACTAVLTSAHGSQRPTTQRPPHARPLTRGIGAEDEQQGERKAGEGDKWRGSERRQRQRARQPARLCQLVVAAHRRRHRRHKQQRLPQVEHLPVARERGGGGQEWTHL